MTENLSTTPAPRSRLLPFLLLVVLLHALILGSIPFLSTPAQPPQTVVSIDLGPLTTTPDETGETVTTPQQSVDPSSTPKAAAPAPLKPAPSSAPVIATVKSAPRRTTADPAPKPPSPSPSPPDPAQPPAVQPSPGVAANPRPAVPSSDTPPVPDPRPAPDWRTTYQQELEAALARHHHYPARAKRFGLTGTAQVAFVIQADGRFSQIRLIKTSGADLLDQAALDTVQQLGRLRPLPAGYSGDGWAVSVPLAYRLD